MLRRFQLNCAAGLAVALVLAISGMAQANLSGKVPDKQSLATATSRMRAAFDRYNDWMSASWTSDPGSAYTSIASRIDREISSGKPATDVFKGYSEQRKNRPGSESALFAYVYSAYAAANSEPGLVVPDSIDEYKAINEFAASIQNNESRVPHSYSFVRLGFLCAPGDFNLVGVGRRLLAYDQNDLKVKSVLVKDLNVSDGPRDRSLAAKYLAEIVRLQPDTSSTSELVSEVDWRSALISHDQAIGRRYVSEKLRAAAGVPAGSYARRVFESEASEMKQRISDWESETRNPAQPKSTFGP